MALPRILWPPLFLDEFRYRGSNALPGAATIPDAWTITSGDFSTRNERELAVNVAGELTYQDTSLDQLVEFASDNANFVLVVRLFGREDLRVQIRARYQDASNYIALDADFESGTISIQKTVAGSTSTVTLASHSFKYDGIRYYSIELWMLDSTIYGVVNGAILVSETVTEFITEPGFSINVPSINEEDPITISKFAAHELVAHYDPQLEDETTNLLVSFRREMKSLINEPSTKNWATYKRAMKLWQYHRNLGHPNNQWKLLGYPIQHPSTEDYLN